MSLTPERIVKRERWEIYGKIFRKKSRKTGGMVSRLRVYV